MLLVFPKSGDVCTSGSAFLRVVSSSLRSNDFLSCRLRDGALPSRIFVNVGWPEGLALQVPPLWL